MKKTGIRDLARECGVSKSAVARVLNNQPGVAPEIRKLVLEFARSMNYRNMSHGHFPVVAVLVSGFHYGFYRSRIEQNVREELHRNGCRSLIVTDCDLALLSETVIDGVISICYDDRIAKIWGNLKNLPLVCINDDSRHLDGIFAVRSNPYQSQREIVAHLTSLGHSRIGMLRMDAHYSPRYSKLRYEGFFCAMREVGLEKHAYFQSFRQPAEFECAMFDLLKNPITAVIVMGEGFGAQAAHVLKQFGKRIPEDISLVTQGIPWHSEYLSPPQTCIIQDYEALARNSVAMLKQLMNGDICSGDVVVNSLLRIGSSTAPPCGVGI